MESNGPLNLSDSEYVKIKAERQLRPLVAMAVVPALFAISMFMYIFISKDIEYSSYYKFLNLLVPASLALSGIAMVMIYLQTGFKKTSYTAIDYSKFDNELKSIKKRIENRDFASNSDITRLQTQIQEIKLLYSNIESLNVALSSNEKDEIIALLKNDILEKSSIETSKEIFKRIEDEVLKKNSSFEVEMVLGRTLDRLSTEIQSLTRRGNLNLSLGIVTTIIGLSILGYFVLESGPVTGDKMAFIANFIPRLSLVILIEVFAYFFLKLYKSSLSEIKYFQNEMTNIEAKLAAVKTTISHADKDILAGVVQSLSITERNAVLEKGQTTVEIEKSRLETQNTNMLLEKLSKLTEIKKKE